KTLRWPDPHQNPAEPVERLAILTDIPIDQFSLRTAVGEFVLACLAEHVIPGIRHIVSFSDGFEVEMERGMEPPVMIDDVELSIPAVGRELLDVQRKDTGVAVRVS